MRLLTLAVLLVALFPGVVDPAKASAAYPVSQAGPGFLDVSSDPPAKVIIDDTDTGKITPQPHLALKAGHHKLTLVTLDGAHKRTLGFTIEAGETRKFTVHLTSQQATRHAAL
jgi:hypothetical protein